VPEALQKLAATDRTLSNRFLEDTRASSTLKNARDLPAPNSVDGLALLRASDPDLFVSIRYRRILKDAAIAIPRHGVLNLHSGILPDYRGVMATFWAMLHGEAEIGSTLHRIVDSGIDTGPVIRISRQPLLAGDSYLANVLSLYQPGCDAILAAIAAIGSGDEPVASQQKTGDGRYFSTPKEDDLALFFRQGGQLAHGAELDSVRPK
jgi:methionyl-tRNA formyltransferase